MEALYSRAEEIVKTAIERGKTFSFAESCTGGLISSVITTVSGSSEVFLGGVVAYSNRLKESLLNVSAGTLQSSGAVSSETAIEMVKGIQRVTSADFSISVTGIAGPTGGTLQKPVGLVYIACSGTSRREIFRECHFRGNREEIRYETVCEAFELLYAALLDG